MKAEIAVPPGVSKRCLSTTDLGPVVMRKEYLQAEFAGREISQLLIGERYLHLPDAELEVRFRDNEIEISTDAYARQVTFAADGVTGAVFEDNFFDLPPGRARTLAVVDAKGVRQITVRALNADPIVLKAK